MSRHGILAFAARKSSDSRLTPSPIIIISCSTAACVFRSSRKLSPSSPPTNWTARRHARRMSAIVAWSRACRSGADMFRVRRGFRRAEQRHGLLKDRCPTHHVRAALDGPTREEIDWSPEQPGQLLLHQRVFDQSPVRARLECDEDVDITVGPEVSPYHRPEQLQIIHLPALAEGEQLRLAHPIQTEPR